MTIKQKPKHFEIISQEEFYLQRASIRCHFFRRPPRFMVFSKSNSQNSRSREHRVPPQHFSNWPALTRFMGTPRRGNKTFAGARPQNRKKRQKQRVGTICGLITPGPAPAWKPRGCAHLISQLLRSWRPRCLPSWGTCMGRPPVPPALGVFELVPLGHERSRLEKEL